MLTLRRRRGEAIVIDGGIRVTVVSCCPDGVRLGIEAPDAIAIHKAELVEECGPLPSLAKAVRSARETE